MTPPAAQFVDAATSPLPTNKYAILDGDTIAKLNLRDGDAGVSRPQAAANSSGQHAADQAMNTTTTPLILTSEVLASIAPPLPLHLVSPVASDEVRELENVFIPMKDGIRLAARIWLPKTAGESNRVPAVFELLPYGKRHGTVYRDEINYRYLARFGFAGVRMDIRGTCDSEGFLEDEYLPQEQEDAITAIEWIAKQPWSDGSVGMAGISWGGFNALQVAAHRPPALKGILSISSSENRYMTDVHYAGGCLITDNISWAAFMHTLLGNAPDPALVGHDKWRGMWMERLEKETLWLKKWMDHPWYDDYWKQGSVCEDFSKIQCPVLTASGWADIYCNTVPTLVANINPANGGLIRGVNGPWSHNLPHMGFPGPKVDWLSETIKWWNYCLRGDKAMEAMWKASPMYSAFMGEYQVPNIIVEERLGRWVAEKQWPSPDLVKTTYFLTHERGLTTEHGNVKARTYADFSSPLSTGMDCGRQGYGKDPDFPIDQRHEDANSLTFDSAILGERLEILGTVEVELNLACSTETGFIAVRLCDFDPQNKSSSLVSFGILNLTHMKSHESPERLKPGKMYRDVKVVLNTTAYAFPAGHRIRIAVSTSFWPMVWPSADNTAISLATIYEDGADGVDPTTISRVHFPVRKAPQTLEQLAEDRPRYSGFYRDPRHADATAMTELRPAKLGTRHLLTDVVTGTKKLILTKDYGLYLDEDNGIEHDEWMEETHTIKDPKHVYETPDPLTARTEINYYIEAGRSRAFTERLVEQGRYAGISDKSKVPATDWRFRIETKTAVTSSKTHFRIESELIAYDFKGIGEKRERVEVFRRKWDESVERKLT